MSITKISPSKYQVAVHVRINGKVLHKQKTVFGSSVDAREAESNLRKSILSERCSIGISTFSEVVDVFLGSKSAEYLEKQAYRFEIMKREIGKSDPSAPEFREKFEAYLRILSAEGKKDATLNRYLEGAKAAINYCVKLQKIEKNHLEYVPKKKETPRDRTLTPEEKNKLLNVISTLRPHLYWITKFALQVPCRRSELQNMKREDLDLPNKVIRIRSGTSKNDLGMWKPIPPDMIEYFSTLPSEADYLFFWPKPQPRKNKSKPASDRRSYGTPLGNVYRSWRWCLKEANIKDFRFHDTRHGAATDLVNAGVAERVVSAVAGWKTNMLSTYYHRDGVGAAQAIFDYSTDKKPSEKILSFPV
jgi:integrase